METDVQWNIGVSRFNGLAVIQTPHVYMSPTAHEWDFQSFGLYVHYIIMNFYYLLHLAIVRVRKMLDNFLNDLYGKLYIYMNTNAGSVDGYIKRICRQYSISVKWIKLRQAWDSMGLENCHADQWDMFMMCHVTPSLLSFII